MKNVRTPAAKLDGRSAATAALSAVMPRSARGVALARGRGGATPPATKDAPGFYALLEQCRTGAAAVRASRQELTKVLLKGRGRGVRRRGGRGRGGDRDLHAAAEVPVRRAWPDHARRHAA